MLSIRGQDNYGHSTKLNNVIQQFNTYEKFEFKLDDESAYVKINLYYKNQLTEDTLFSLPQRIYQIDKHLFCICIMPNLDPWINQNSNKMKNI